MRSNTLRDSVAFGLAIAVMLIAIGIQGCMKVDNGGTRPDPVKPAPVKPDTPPDTDSDDNDSPTLIASKAEFYRGLIRYLRRVRSDKTTEDFLSTAKLAREDLGLPPGGDSVTAALGDLVKEKKPLTDDLKKQLIERLQTLADQK